MSAGGLQSDGGWATALRSGGIPGIDARAPRGAPRDTDAASPAAARPLARPSLLKANQTSASLLNLANGWLRASWEEPCTTQRWHAAPLSRLSRALPRAAASTMRAP